MNRPIKFRIWDKEGGTDGMIGWDFIKKAGWSVEDLFDDKMLIVMQFAGFHDKNKKEVYEGDIVRVYDEERYCICDDWEDCDAPSDMECKEHGEHKHESPTDCEKFVCTQAVEWSDYTGYFCEEDTGDYCPSLSSDEIQVEIIGNIYENPELIKK